MVAFFKDLLRLGAGFALFLVAAAGVVGGLLAAAIGVIATPINLLLDHFHLSGGAIAVLCAMFFGGLAAAGIGLLVFKAASSVWDTMGTDPPKDAARMGAQAPSVEADPAYQEKLAQLALEDDRPFFSN